ncbi:hypothetical protein KPH14_002373 [Odynerus spinipes]|uniref:Fork-head domain-containing protein n=1 Tax=Odynerus spinipes TaxID=1348599 RepID=A0AAD9RMJ4_9HYME|nr:hypothetical protein KPH14_002373 [Odynerus spinipes]
MIGPSASTASVSNHEIVNAQARSSKRKIFEDLDINSFCEEVWQNGRKRYLQELETPVELIMSNQTIDDSGTLLSASSIPDTTDERSVTRLKVLVVDGTNYAWTTVSDLDAQQIENGTELASCTTVSSPFSSSSSLSSSTSLEGHSQDILYTDVQTIDETTSNYQQVIRNGFWEPINPVVTLPPPNCQLSRLKQQHSVQPIVNNGELQYQQFDDQENGNLSWLLDFKLDPFIAAADDNKYIPLADFKDHCGSKNKSTNRGHGSVIYAVESKKVFGNGQDASATFAHGTSQKSSYMISETNQDFSTASTNGPKKPPFTYTELIEHALQERGELTVSAIYQWISEHFPYYKSNDDRWKNSVRHNLSINPHFRKGSKAPHGAGHLWAIANRGDTRPHSTITADPPKYSLRSIVKDVEYNNTRRQDATNGQIRLLDEIEAATASITRQSSEEENDDIVNSTTLEHCAEQILSGIKKEVEVQYLVPMMVSNGTSHNTSQGTQQHTQTNFDCSVKESDFLNPISKEVVAEECGLISEGFLVTDMNSAALGLNMVESEIISPENLFGEELNFQFYELSPSQLQSA